MPAEPRLASCCLHDALSQVGQCGNQLGQAFWQLFEQQHALSSSSARDLNEGAAQFYRLDHQDRRQARCLLIDTEPKVVRSGSGAVCE